MTGPQIDYQEVFRCLPYPVAVFSPDFIILDVNDEYLATTGRMRKDVLGRSPFDVFPENPTDQASSGPRDFRASLEAVLASGEPDVLALNRYDVEYPGMPGVFEERYWTIINTPLFCGGSCVVMILMAAREATPVICQLRAARDVQG